MAIFEESDEYCPHCDNHFVLEAKTPTAVVGVEGEDARVDNRMLKDERAQQKQREVSRDSTCLLDEVDQCVAALMGRDDQRKAGLKFRPVVAAWVYSIVWSPSPAAAGAAAGALAAPAVIDCCSALVAASLESERIRLMR